MADDTDYWNSSSVTDKVNRQGIFDSEGSNTVDVSFYKYIIFILHYICF